MITIQIQEINSPGHFFCREIDSETASLEHQHFLQLQEELNQVFNQEQTVQQPYIPSKGEICIAFRQKDRKWYRVRNEGVFARKYGQEACCYFVDKGGEAESISVRWLRKSPERFLKLPFQIKECSVFGVKALTLAIQEDLSVAEKSCLKWDDSATTFMEKCVKRSVSASAKVLYTDNTGRMHVILYLNKGRETYNFNDLLVARKYAVTDETDGQIAPDQLKTTMTRNTKFLQNLLAEKQDVSFSDSEIFGMHHTPSPLHSDSDYSKTLKQYTGPEYLSDTNYKGRSISSSTLIGKPPKMKMSPTKKRERRSEDSADFKQILTNYKDSLSSEDNTSQRKNENSRYVSRAASLSGNVSDTGMIDVSNINRNNLQVHTSYSDTESFSRGRSLSPTTITLGRGRASSPLTLCKERSPSPLTLSRGRSPSPMTLSRGSAPPVSSALPPTGRGRGQLDILRLAMNFRLPASSPSSASDIDSDHKSSTSPQINMSLFNKLRDNPVLSSSLDSGGARPKVYKGVPGQFDDSESDSSAALSNRNSGLPIDTLLRNDTNVPLTRGRLPKAALSRIGMSSGSDTDNSKNISSILKVNQQVTFTGSDKQDTNHEMRKEEMSEMDLFESPKKEKSSVRFSDDVASSSGAECSPSKKKSPSLRTMTEEEKRRADMISKQQGHQLLSILKPSCNTTGILGGVSLRGIEPVRMDNLDQVLVHSADRINPITDLKDAPIGKLMREALRQLDFPAPRLIQAYAWKCILRGMNFVGLSPPDSGKTLGYLIPIISQILNTGRYATLPKGPGPYAVVLVPSWKKVRHLLCVTHGLLQGDKKIRIIELYGSGEDLKMCPLINGCEILLCTPPSLKRVLELNYVHLNRLCHLVVDDAEVTLNNFTEEVRFIVKTYSDELRKQDERTAPQQLMLFGTQWESKVQSFISSYMCEPKIAITSRYEASLYGKVRQIPVVCHSMQKPNKFLDILDDILKDNCKLIIFASTVNLACNVFKLLQSRSLCALLAHDSMDKFDIEEKSSSWYCDDGEEPIILVATDGSIPHLYINNATTIIHYDLPDSKTKFGNRMSCMSRHYWNFLTKDEEQRVKPTSYILITEESTETVDTISKLLIRSKVKLPVQLRQMLAGRNQALNLDKEKKLCHYLKAFGRCRHEDVCKDRHLIVPDIDGRSKLTCGYVKIRMTNIVDASHFHGIIQEHKAPDGTVTDLRCDYTNLLFQMQSFFGDHMNRQRHTNMCIGDVCAYEFSEIFHRVKITDLGNLNSNDGGIMATVKFVDDGTEQKVEAKKLFDLPQKLKNISFQAVDVFICRLKPIDSDEDWTPRASMFMHELIEHKELDGRIVLSMENTLWLDPLVEEIELTAVGTKVHKMYVRSELLKNGFAVDNTKHLQNLFELCKGKIKIPDINKELHKSEETLSVDLLPENSEFHEVYVSAVELPNLFFVQRKESCKQLEKMMDCLNNTMDRSDENMPFTEEDLNEAICAAKFPDDDRWYRVKVICEQEEGNVEVFYGDYGDKRTVTREDLFQLPQDFMMVPFQAIECELAHVQPRGDDWDDESGDLFWDLTHMINDDKKRVMASVVSKSPAVYAGLYKYEIVLYDTDTSDDVNLCQELVWSSLASPKPNSPLQFELSQELCPIPQMGRKIYKSTAQKIPDLCGIIYWEKITERAKKAPKDIFTIVQQNLQSAPLDLIGYKALASIIKMIGRISDPPSHQWILESLFSSARASTRLQDEIIEQECGIGIVKCLEQNCRPDIQEQAIISIDKFLEISNSFLSVFNNRRTIEILCQFLDVTERISTLVEIYAALSSLCVLSSRIYEWAQSFDVCTVAQKHLEKISDTSVEEAALKYLVKLMERSADHLRKDKLIRAVVSVLDKSQSEKCILYGVKLCDNYCHDNRKNKTILLEYGVAVILTRILNSVHISEDTRKHCQTLYHALVVKVPQSTSITNRPTGHIESLKQGAQPPVHWVQNTFIVVVSIKIKAVVTCHIAFQPRTLEFKTKVDGKLYSFFYELYDEVNPAKCKYEIRGSEVGISLRKVEKGQWPRLLRQKQKPSNLSVDFERFVDSSSDSEVCDDERPFMLTKSKNKQLPSNLKKPSAIERNANDVSSEESSSVSDEEVKYKTSAEYNPYDVFN
ncbi:uncharacterized protein LOC127701133 isoform X2 [Mytilus californianus]|uniref:uncharacterized protein LOC127701133 isoform X2 n=1 Tax=Mytilus californianus TaxID=6549 RepID=UPI002246F45F|nr:uncharacterized protein LOC127701133 isoform X2 [Mytilus californianus]